MLKSILMKIWLLQLMPLLINLGLFVFLEQVQTRAFLMVKNPYGGRISRFYLMDEASGNYFGKRLIRDYYYKFMGEDMSREFAKRYDLDADTIKSNVYKKENPNTYLASFAEFIFTSEERNGYFYKLIYEGMEKFIERRVMCYRNAQNVPIHFIGSIAFFSEDIIRDVAKRYHLNIGNIIRRPIDGLINHYQKNVIPQLKEA